MVEIEVQFMKDGAIDSEIFKSFFKTFIIKQDWVDNTIWTNVGCLEDGIYCKIQRKYINVRFVAS